MLESAYRLSAVELWVHKLLRVPPRPEPPDGAPGSIEVFRAGRNYSLRCMFIWLISWLFVLAILLGLHLTIEKLYGRFPEWARITWRVMEGIALSTAIAAAALTFLSQRVNYALRWYIVTDRSLRLRTGAIRMQELTMTFSNIQEIRVTAGPLQNLLGLADVEVQSAGGASGGHDSSSSHMGRFEGVSNANAIRDLLVERLRSYRDSGLGETPHAEGPSMNDVEAARSVLVEVRALRASL